MPIPCVCYRIYVSFFFFFEKFIFFLVLIRAQPKFVFEHSVQYLRHYPSYFGSPDQFLGHFFANSKSGSAGSSFSENSGSEYVMFQFLAEACLENIGEPLLEHLPLLIVNALALYGPNRTNSVQFTFVRRCLQILVSSFYQVVRQHIIEFRIQKCC